MQIKLYHAANLNEQLYALHVFELMENQSIIFCFLLFTKIRCQCLCVSFDNNRNYDIKSKRIVNKHWLEIFELREWKRNKNLKTNHCHIELNNKTFQNDPFFLLFQVSRFASFNFWFFFMLYQCMQYSVKTFLYKCYNFEKWFFALLFISSYMYLIILLIANCFFITFCWIAQQKCYSKLLKVVWGLKTRIALVSMSRMLRSFILWVCAHILSVTNSIIVKFRSFHLPNRSLVLGIITIVKLSPNLHYPNIIMRGPSLEDSGTIL